MIAVSTLALADEPGREGATAQPAPSAGADQQPVGTPPAGKHNPAPASSDGSPHWLDAVRAQRQAIQQRRRAKHEARRRAIDPLGSARQEAHDQEFERRRRELRERIAEDRKLFMNSGPWQKPWPEAPQFGPHFMPKVGPGLPPPDAASSPSEEPPEWDNGWYYRGW